MYNTSRSSKVAVINLLYPPVPGTVQVFIGEAPLTETFVDLPNSDQYYVDYTESQIRLNREVAQARVEYIPSYVFINPNNPYRINFYHDQIFGSYVGAITVGYDAAISLNLRMLHPNLQDTFVNLFPIIIQNNLIFDDRSINRVSLDF